MKTLFTTSLLGLVLFSYQALAAPTSGCSLTTISPSTTLLPDFQRISDSSRISLATPIGERFYEVYLPSTYSPGATDTKVIITFHGGGDGDDVNPEAIFPGLVPTANMRGYMVVRPISHESNKWDYARDLPYLNALLDELETNYCYDDSLVFMTGHSNGSFFINDYNQLQENPRARAIAPVSGGSDASDNREILLARPNPPTKVLSSFTLHGVNDTIKEFGVGLRTFKNVCKVAGCRFPDGRLYGQPLVRDTDLTFPEVGGSHIERGNGHVRKGLGDAIFGNLDPALVFTDTNDLLTDPHPANLPPQIICTNVVADNATIGFCTYGQAVDPEESFEQGVVVFDPKAHRVGPGGFETVVTFFDGFLPTSFEMGTVEANERNGFTTPVSYTLPDGTGRSTPDLDSLFALTTSGGIADGVTVQVPDGPDNGDGGMGDGGSGSGGDGTGDGGDTPPPPPPVTFPAQCSLVCVIGDDILQGDITGDITP